MAAAGPKQALRNYLDLDLLGAFVLHVNVALAGVEKERSARCAVAVDVNAFAPGTSPTKNLLVIKKVKLPVIQYQDLRHANQDIEDHLLDQNQILILCYPTHRIEKDRNNY